MKLRLISDKKPKAAGSIDTRAVLNYLGVALPDVIPGIQQAATTWAQIAAIGQWLVTAAVENDPAMIESLGDLMAALQSAYQAASVAFERQQPGYQAELKAAGMKLILVPPVQTDAYTVQ